MFKNHPIPRRTLLALACALTLAPSQGALHAAEAVNPFEALEKKTGAEIGVVLLDELGASILEWRQNETFAMNETVVALLALRVLEKHWKDRSEPASLGGDAPYAPVFSKKKGGDIVTYLEALRAASSVNDHRAANFLINALGGPNGVHAWVQYKGDLKTSVNRLFPDNAKTQPRDMRDSTSPASVMHLWQRIYIDFTPDERIDFETVLGWNERSGHLMKAQLPEGWSLADRTGEGASDMEANRSLHGLLFDPDGNIYFTAVHVRMPAGATLEARDEVMKAASALVLEAAAAASKARAA